MINSNRIYYITDRKKCQYLFVTFYVQFALENIPFMQNVQYMRPRRAAKRNKERTRRAAERPLIPFIIYIFYLSSSLVRGNSTVSRILDMPVTYIIMRSSPSPNPLCGTLPNRRRSR